MKTNNSILDNIFAITYNLLLDLEDRANRDDLNTNNIGRKCIRMWNVFIPGIPGSPDRPYWTNKDLWIRVLKNNSIEYLLCHLFDQADQVNPDHLFLLSYPQVLKREVISLLNRISVYTKIAYLQDRVHHPILEHLQDPWDQLDPNYNWSYSLYKHVCSHRIY